MSTDPSPSPLGVPLAGHKANRAPRARRGCARCHHAVLPPQVVVVTEYAEGELFQILEDDGSLPEEQVSGEAVATLALLQDGGNGICLSAGRGAPRHCLAELKGCKEGQVAAGDSRFPSTQGCCLSCWHLPCQQSQPKAGAGPRVAG